MEGQNKNEDNVILEKFTEMIKNGDNFSFTKFGDGEVRCMKNWLYGKNCDGDRYNKWLSDSLNKAFVELIKRDSVYIGKWHDSAIVEYLLKKAKKNRVENINWVHYHTVMNTSPESNAPDYNSFTNDKMLNFVKIVKFSRRKKILFTNNDNKKLKDLFLADIFIETKKNNWSYEYQDYYKKVEKECCDKAILIIAAGMCSKVLISDLLKKFNMTCIDIGSGFDIIATGKNTRAWTHLYTDEVAYYSEILPSNW